MDDNNVALDEARRVAQHEQIKSHVEHDVSKDIERRTDSPAPGDSEKLTQVASNLRGGAIAEVSGKDREVKVARGLARGSGVIDYIFYLIYGLLAIRLVLVLIAANSANGFVQLIATVTNPFYAIFRGIVPSQTVENGPTIAVPIIIAIVAYALLHAAISGFLRTIANRKTTI